MVLRMELGELLGGRFELEQQLAAGGRGRVFRARDRVSGDAVAVKVMSEVRAQHIARFAREVELLAELSHPAIVRYVSHGETPSGELFLAMEWLDGEDLTVRLGRGALLMRRAAEPSAVPLARGPRLMGESVTLRWRVAEALGAAHVRGVVHRDLKSSTL